MRLKQLIRVGVGLIAAVFFVWLIARQISLAELTHAFIGTYPAYFGSALFIFLLGYSCRIERWRLMLTGNNQNLTWHQCAGPLMASFAANNVLPFRAGDVLRAVAFNNELGVSAGNVVATLFIERLLDLLMLLFLLGVALSVFNLDVGGLIGLGSGTLIGISISILFFLLKPKFFTPFILFFGKIFAKLAPHWGGIFLIEANKSLATLVTLAKGRTMIKLVVWSLGAWLSEGCVFWMTALALPSITEPVGAWLALPVGTLATLIPSTPGYIGTFDYFTVHAMTALGNERSASTAFALVVHVLLWLPPTLIGGLYLLVRQTRIKQTQ